jgi:hypothetical protein
LRRLAAQATQREPLTLPGRERDNVHRRPQDPEIVCHSTLVLIGEVAVNLADQNSAVRMPQPVRNSHEVQATHYALAGKEMPQVMESDPRQSSRAARQSEGFPQTSGVNVLGAALG